MKLTKMMSFFDSTVLKKYTSPHHSQLDSISFFPHMPVHIPYSKLQVDYTLFHEFETIDQLSHHHSQARLKSPKKEGIAVVLALPFVSSQALFSILPASL